MFFNDGWVDYDDRQNYLLDADVGVSTHLDHVETAFSFRTRILDYLWASLPVVATAGDSFAELIEVRKLGLVVPPGDVDALESALYTILTDSDFAQACRVNISAAAPEFRWGRVLVPVLDLCAQPRRAPDLVDPRQRVMIGDPIAQAMWGRRGLAYSVRVALRHVKRREYGELTRRPGCACGPRCSPSQPVRRRADASSRRARSALGTPRTYAPNARSRRAVISGRAARPRRTGATMSRFAYDPVITR